MRRKFEDVGHGGLAALKPELLEAELTRAMGEEIDYDRHSEIKSSYKQLVRMKIVRIAFGRYSKK